MPKFSGYGFPFQYYRPYNYKPRSLSIEPLPPPEEIKTPSPPPRQENQTKPNAPVWFDLFGIKLYFDDVLILSLLFFLYKEEVKDEMLFLALVLLLLS